MKVTHETVQFAKTGSGHKLHLIAGGTEDGALTVCGCYTAQLVLVESPVPTSSLCDWCRAHLERESRGH